MAAVEGGNSLRVCRCCYSGICYVFFFSCWVLEKGCKDSCQYPYCIRALRSPSLQCDSMCVRVFVYDCKFKMVHAPQTSGQARAKSERIFELIKLANQREFAMKELSNK